MAVGAKTQTAMLAVIGWRGCGLPEAAQDAMPTHAARLLINDVFGRAAAAGIEIDELAELRPGLAEAVADIAVLRALGIAAARHAKILLDAVWATPCLDVADALRDTAVLEDASEEDLIRLVDETIAAHPGVVAEIRSGKAKAAGFLVGQVLRAAGGKADPALAKALIAARLAPSGSPSA